MQEHNLSVWGANGARLKRNASVSRCLNSGVSVLGVMQWILPTPAGGTSSRTWEEDLARMALGSYRGSDLRKLTTHFDLTWGTGSKEDLIDRLVADRSAMSVLDCALRRFGGSAAAHTVAQATSGQATNPVVGSDQVERTDATANADTPVAIRDPNPGGFDRDAWNSTDQRQDRWTRRLNEATERYRNSFTSAPPRGWDIERKVVRKVLMTKASL